MLTLGEGFHCVQPRVCRLLEVLLIANHQIGLEGTVIKCSIVPRPPFWGLLLTNGQMARLSSPCEDPGVLGHKSGAAIKTQGHLWTKCYAGKVKRLVKTTANLLNL